MIPKMCSEWCLVPLHQSLLQCGMFHLSTGLNWAVNSRLGCPLHRVGRSYTPLPQYNPPTHIYAQGELTGSRLQRWKGSGRRIYCWVLTCTHSWCCFSPLGPLAIPKASKTTACQVVTAGFKQLLLHCYSEVPSHTTMPGVCVCVCLNICISEVHPSQCFCGSMLECIHSVFLWCINIQRKLTRVCLHVSGSMSKGGKAVSSREGKDLG